MVCVFGSCARSFGDEATDSPSATVWAGVELEVRRLNSFGGGGGGFLADEVILAELEGGIGGDGKGTDAFSFLARGAGTFTGFASLDIASETEALTSGLESSSFDLVSFSCASESLLPFFGFPPFTFCSSEGPSASSSSAGLS
jgi:hypothetical protein